MKLTFDPLDGTALSLGFAIARTVWKVPPCAFRDKQLTLSIVTNYTATAAAFYFSSYWGYPGSCQRVCAYQ